MNAAIQILRLAAVIGLVVGAAALATPPGRLPLAGISPMGMMLTCTRAMERSGVMRTPVTVMSELPNTGFISRRKMSPKSCWMRREILF